MLQVRHLCKKLTDKEHVFQIKDITFHLPKGHICGLIGENGAGKSSLIRLLCGLYGANDGEIIIDGCSMTEKENEARSRPGLALDESFYGNPTAKRAESPVVAIYRGFVLCHLGTYIFSSYSSCTIF